MVGASVVTITVVGAGVEVVVPLVVIKTGPLGTGSEGDDGVGRGVHE